MVLRLLMLLLHWYKKVVDTFMQVVSHSQDYGSVLPSQSVHCNINFPGADFYNINGSCSSISLYYQDDRFLVCNGITWILTFMNIILLLLFGVFGVGYVWLKQGRYSGCDFNNFRLLLWYNGLVMLLVLNMMVTIFYILLVTIYTTFTTTPMTVVVRTMDIYGDCGLCFVFLMFFSFFSFSSIV